MKFIQLAKEYDLVVGDRFELFYRGVICLNNPYEYQILVRCDKGNPLPRYYTFTPKPTDVGEYELTISLIDNNLAEIDKAKTILKVNMPEESNKKLNVLCFGDSITFNGVWPAEGYRRYSCTGGEPDGNGFKNTLNMLGTCKKEVNDETIGYEGYGSWTWRSYSTNDNVSMNSPVWITVDKHNFDENDQHSVWKNNNMLWVLESILPNKLKFKRGERNNTPSPKILEKFEHVEGGFHHDDIEVKGYEFELSNPFWNKEKNDVDIKAYINKLGEDSLDLVYVMLTWNGIYVPYNTNFNHHLDYAKFILKKIHDDFPNAHITIMGIQVCSVNGGIALNYGANGPYSDTFGEISSCFNYNKQLEELALSDEFKEYCRYVDTKAMFDSEYNMPAVEMPVNARSKKTEFVGTNGVHPSMDGYLQLGDVFYRALVRDINDRNNK